MKDANALHEGQLESLRTLYEKDKLSLERRLEEISLQNQEQLKVIDEQTMREALLSSEIDELRNVLLYSQDPKWW